MPVAKKAKAPRHAVAKVGPTGLIVYCSHALQRVGVVVDVVVWTQARWHTVAASIQDHQSVRVEVVGAVPALPQHPHRGVTMVHGENPAPRQVAQDLSQALATGAVGRYGCPLRVVLGAVPALPQHPHRGVTMVHGENPAPRQVAQDLSQALATGAADQHGCRRRVVAGGRQLPKYRQPVGIGVTRPASIHKATVRYTAKTGILKAPEGVVPETCRRPVLRASPRGERK